LKYTNNKAFAKRGDICSFKSDERAAVSIPSNIAEGQQRQSTKEFVNFLSISRGSNAEIETQLIICEKLNYLTAEQIKYAMSLCGEIGKMLNAMIVKLS
jgi:four helix bundle protein